MAKEEGRASGAPVIFDPSGWQRCELTGDYIHGDWKVERWHDERDNWYSISFRGCEVREIRNKLECALVFPATEAGRSIAMEVRPDAQPSGGDSNA